jgi:predicted transposase YbfD/YdcC
VNQFNMDELMECFAYVEDPRVQGRSKHLFVDIIVISICAMLCGAETCTEIELFGNQKEDWLRQYLDLPCGIPSHDTIGRTLSLVDPLQMEMAFRNWVETITKGSEKPKTISIDGKSVAGTERKFTKHPLHLVNAYSHELGLSLFQTEATYRGTGEVEGALECLDVLDVKDVTVLADAALSVKRMTDKIREKKGHYLLPIKGNQRRSLEEIIERFDSAGKKIKRAQGSNEGRGRSEVRICEVLPANNLSTDFFDQWRDIKTIMKVTRHRELQKPSVNSTEATRKREDITYYISSRELTAAEGLKEVRKHWAIENGLHWVLDIAFSEDCWRTRAKALARSLSVLRKIAFNIIRASKTTGSIRGRIKQAGWNNDFLSQLVFGG